MILDDIKNFINSKVSSYVEIKFDVLGENESIIIRQLPSNSVVDRYMDGSRASDFDFQIFAKSLDQEKAIAQLKEYETVLDLPTMFKLTENCSVKIEPDTDVRFVLANPDKTVVYSNSFKLEYFIERE